MSQPIPPRIPQLFRQFYEIAHQHRLRYLVVGGVAVNLHGYSRPTADLDIWLPRPMAADQVSVFKTVLESLGYQPNNQDFQEFIQGPGLALEQAEHDQVYKIKFLRNLGKEERDFNLAYASAVHLRVQSFQVAVIGLSSLIQLKYNRASQQDMQDIVALRALAERTESNS